MQVHTSTQHNTTQFNPITTSSSMSSLLIQAAHNAAQADGLPNPQLALSGGHHAAAGSMAPPPVQQPPNNNNMKKKGPPLRRGKWTPEEEAYANRLIQEFKAGLLPLTDGTTLRTFLSKLLNCDPMRISKKFVGSNCIGKQVFRRRTADLNRLTPEQIQQSRAELSELERRFLERVAQTNRVKSSGVGGPASQPDVGLQSAAAAAAVAGKHHKDVNGLMNSILNGVVGGGGGGGGIANGINGGIGGANNGMLGGLNGNNNNNMEPPMPPWLQPPIGYKHGAGAAFAAASQGGSNSRAAAAGRALLQGGHFQQQQHRPQSHSLQPKMPASSHGSAQLLAMAELQRQASQSNLLQNLGSASNLLAAASGSGTGLSQLAANSSAARLASLADNGGNSSVTNLMLQSGLSREQLSHLAQNRGLSSSSLSSVMQRQTSFDALMSLDFQSLQSIDNLANLIQSNANNVPESGLKNADFQFSQSRNNMAAPPAPGASAVPSTTTSSSSGDLTKRLASAGRMESLLRTLSNNNFNGGANASTNGFNSQAGSNANLSNLLQSVQQQQEKNQQSGNLQNFSSAASLLGNGASAVSLANLLRQDSSTGLSALRVQDGLNQRNSSVEDFLSLVAAGDIPHQDPSLLNVPLVQQQPGNAQEAAKQLIAKQQLIQAASSGNLALVNAIASRSFGNLQSQQGAGASTSSLALTRQLQQQAANGVNKRKSEELNGAEQQRSAKRSG